MQPEKYHRPIITSPMTLATVGGVSLFTLLLYGLLFHNMWAGEQSLDQINGSSHTNAATASGDSIEGGSDWPLWQGPFRNHTSNEVDLISNWNPQGGEGSNLLWKNEKLATRCTPVVMNGRLYVNCRSDEGTSTEGERVVCADAVTGKIIWETKSNVYLSDVPAERVGWSSVTCDPSTGNVYALGVCGLFQCLDGKTGEVLWKQSMHEKYGLLSTYGGRTNTPVIIDDLVIISAIVIGWGDMAKPAHRFIAFDKKTGTVVWFRGTRLLPYDTNYSTPVLTVLDGQAALVFGSGDGAVWALQPRTGKKIWNFRFSGRGLNTSPLVVGNTVYMGHSEENLKDVRMGAVVAIDATKKGDITRRGKKWIQFEKMVGKSSPIMLDKGRMVVVDDRAKIWMLDTKTGKTLSSKSLGTSIRGTPLYADGKLYICTTSGTWWILQPEGRRFKVIQNRLRLGEETHGSPIVSHGRIYLPTMRTMYCIGNKDVKPRHAKPLTLAKEPPVGDDKTVAHLQLIPAEVILKPGEKLQFKVRAYNKRGQEVKLDDSTVVKYGSEGTHTFSSDGLFTAGSELKHSATTVRITAPELKLSATARVRIVPPLPWKFDFEMNQIPVTWVGARYRHVVAKQGDNHVMKKVNTIPKGTRSQAWFGQPNLSDYTIQADAMGTVKGNNPPTGMPDIGITAQGYILALRGASQELQIRSWATQLRMAKTIKFSWKPKTWYTMKFKASIVKKEGKDVALLQGKVWVKGDKEPEKWTIETTDASPQKQGSPGLFGDASLTEFYLDNIIVTPNKE